MKKAYFSNLLSALSLMTGVASGMQPTPAHAFPAPDRSGTRVCNFDSIGSGLVKANRYKDTIAYSAFIGGSPARRILESCGGGAGRMCRYTLQIFKSDRTWVGPAMNLQATVEEGEILLGSENFLHLPYYQDILSPSEFSGMSEGDIESGEEQVQGNLHALVTVTNNITGDMVTSWTATSPVLSFPGVNTFVDGKCVQDGFFAEFGFATLLD